MHPGVRHGARRRRRCECEQPHYFSWRPAWAGDAEWMFGKSRSRLAPALTEAPHGWMSDRRAQRSCLPDLSRRFCMAGEPGSRVTPAYATRRRPSRTMGSARCPAGTGRPSTRGGGLRSTTSSCMGAAGAAVRRRQPRHQAQCESMVKEGPAGLPWWNYGPILPVQARLVRGVSAPPAPCPQRSRLARCPRTRRSSRGARRGNELVDSSPQPVVREVSGR